MTELPGGRLVFAVGQLPFDAASQETQNINTFATLVPVLDERGRPARRDDFPQTGLVWWMLRAAARAFAEPGRLVSARLEYAKRYDSRDPESHLFQVDLESVEPVRDNSVMEVLTVTSTRVQNARDLVNMSGVVELDHPPSAFVMVRWRDSVYGPLRASSERRDDSVYAVSLSTRGGDREVMRVPDSSFSALKEDLLSRGAVDVSLESRSVTNSTRVQRCHFEILTAAGLDALEASSNETLQLLRDDEILKRVAKPLFQRRERQQLSQLLDKLSDELVAMGEADPEVFDLISRTQDRLRRGDALAGELADSLIKSGLIDDSLNERVQKHADAYVASNAVGLRAQIGERTREEQELLERLRDERVRFEETLQRLKRDAQSELQAELSAVRQQHDESMRSEQAFLEGQRRDLESQRELVVRQLAEVTGRYEQARGAVIQDFLTLVPLLERVVPGSIVGAVEGRTSGAMPLTPTAEPSNVGAGLGRDEATLRFPGFVSVDPEVSADISEQELIDRFRNHVRDSGFEYRDLDLLSFHLSVKSGDLTILGGVSGTGKASLPQLYATALAGETSGEELAPEGRYLHVGVRPSWLDQQDLLGHVNSIDGRFIPSDSGLYEFVIWAQREAELKQGRAGVYLACLDEMNLSHVEHYFSGFLQALERPDGSRVVRCFDARSVRAGDPFRAYHQLHVPRCIRFVGTVNYDETTKPLSLRLLDRANVIQLQTTSLRGVEIGGATVAIRRTSGPMVQWQHLRSWVREEELDRPLAEFLDRLRAPLAALHTPLTPRRDRAIRRFVASASGLVPTAWTALDLQLHQRVLPQIRSVFGPEARQALEDLVRLIGEQSSELPEMYRAVSSVAERELGGMDV